METGTNCLVWMLYAFALAPIVLGFGGAMVADLVLPRLIPRKEIERLADELMASFPNDPEEAALAEEHAAWCRSNGYDQGKWRRVRKLLARKLS